MTSPTISAWRRSSSIKVSFADIARMDTYWPRAAVDCAARGAPLRRSGPASRSASRRSSCSSTPRRSVPRNVASELIAALEPTHGELMNDVYEALIEASRRSCAARPRASRCSPPCASSSTTPGATFIGGGVHPDVGVRRRRRTSRRERYQEIRDEMRGLVSRTPTAALHVHVGHAGPRDRDPVCNRMRAHLPLLQALAAHSPFWHGARLRLRQRARAALPRLPALDASRPPSTAGSTTGGRRAGRGRRRRSPDYTFLWWDIRPQPAARARSRCARWTRRRRLESVARARRARARARGRLRGRRGGARPAARGAHGVLVPRRARRPRRDDLVARRAAPDPRGRRPTRSSSRAPTPASSTARTRSRRSSASCARAAARTACAPPTPPAGWTRCSRTSPASPTSPTARPRRRRRSAASRRSPARSAPAPAGSRGWRCTAAPRRSRGWRSRG